MTVTGSGNNLKATASQRRAAGVATANAAVYTIDTVMMPPANLVISLLTPQITQ